MNDKRCGKCGALIEVNALFCSSCGEELKRICPGCRELNAAYAVYCKKCGAHIRKNEVGVVRKPGQKRPAVDGNATPDFSREQILQTARRRISFLDFLIFLCAFLVVLSIFLPWFGGVPGYRVSLLLYLIPLCGLASFISYLGEGYLIALGFSLFGLLLTLYYLKLAFNEYVAGVGPHLAFIGCLALSILFGWIYITILTKKP